MAASNGSRRSNSARTPSKATPAVKTAAKPKPVAVSATARPAPKGSAASPAKDQPQSRALQTAQATRPEVVIPIAFEQIERRAYEIWLERGRPAGQDMEHWAEAERQLQGRFVTS